MPKTAPPPRQQGDHPFDILAIEHKVDTVILDSFVEVLGDAMSCEPYNNDSNQALEDTNNDNHTRFWLVYLIFGSLNINTWLI